MLNKILNTEIEYLKRYASYVEEEKLMRFRDPKLPGMYMHNCTVLTEEVPEDELKAIIEKEMSIGVELCHQTYTKKKRSI